MMRVQVFTDGRRQYIERTIESFEQRVTGSITERVIHDDSGDREHRLWLEATFPSWRIIGGTERSGFGGAIRRAWADIEHSSRAWWVFHLEDDFVFERDVQLGDMASVLSRYPGIAQMALLRQPWNAAERQAGGIIQLHPEAFAENEDVLGNRWTEHRLFFTTNPSLYSVDLVELGWPDGAQSEGRFTHRVLAEGVPRSGAGPELTRFAYWGSKWQTPAVTHIGAERAGTGY